MSKAKKDEKQIPESFELDKSKLTDALKKPVKAIVDGFAHAGAAAAGHALPKQPAQQKPAPAPIKKVDPKTRLPGTLMEKGSMKTLADKSKNLVNALEQKSMKKHDQDWVNHLSRHLTLKKDGAQSTATPPPINQDAAKQITQSFNNATGKSGIVQGIKNFGSALGLGKAEGGIPKITTVQAPTKENTTNISHISTVQAPNASNSAGIPRIQTLKNEEEKPKPKEKPIDAMDIIEQPRATKKSGDIMDINSEPALQRKESKWDSDSLHKLGCRVKMHVGKALSASEKMQKDGATPPPPNPGMQSAQDSMRQAFHFGKSDKNPDEKQDAKLGEDVEHLVEDHMIDNKAAEQKEGHKIMKKCDDPKFLKQLGHQLKKMYGVEMTEKAEEGKMHNSPKGGETQDQKHANDLNRKQEMEKAETLKKPYVSEAQRGFFHTATARKQGISPAMTKEWDKKSKGLKLPKKK